MNKLLKTKTWEEYTKEEKSKFHSLTDEEIEELRIQGEEHDKSKQGGRNGINNRPTKTTNK